ncbi:MAG: nickel-responsive transcriptional regulator NikR [Candidatus Thorarchaeota archaeon]
MVLQRFGVSIPGELLKEFDEVIQRKGYLGRSEAIRDAMRDFISGSRWEAGQGTYVAVLNIVYDNRPSLVSKLIKIQHSSRADIISTVHVHLTERLCLEVITLRGTREEIEYTANKISSISGVEHARLSAVPVEVREGNHTHEIGNHV